MCEFSKAPAAKAKDGHTYRCVIDGVGTWRFWRFVDYETYSPADDDESKHYGVAAYLGFIPKAPLKETERVGLVQVVKRGRKGYSDATSGKLTSMANTLDGVGKFRLVTEENLAAPHGVDADGLPTFVDCFAVDLSPFYGCRRGKDGGGQNLWDTVFDRTLGCFGTHNQRGGAKACLADTPRQLRWRSSYAAVYDDDLSGGQPKANLKGGDTGDSAASTDVYPVLRDDLRNHWAKYIQGTGFTGHFFETAAFLFSQDGKTKRWLSSINWGWKLDAWQFKLIEPSVASKGQPTKFFFDAIKAWNKKRPKTALPEE